MTPISYLWSLFDGHACTLRLSLFYLTGSLFQKTEFAVWKKQQQQQQTVTNASMIYK